MAFLKAQQLLAFGVLFLSACTVTHELSPTSLSPVGTPIPAATLRTGASGAWSPAVTNGGSANLKGTVVNAKTTISVSGVTIAALDTVWGGREVTVDLGVYLSTDFGPNGSMSLVAEAQGYPYEGGVYPVLTSFSVLEAGTGITYEYVNLTSQCASQGMYICSGGVCEENTNCGPVPGQSGFFNRADWDEHQIPAYGYASTNLFPRCDHSVNGWSACPSTLSNLKAGHYYAKYILLADNDTAAGKTVGLTVTKIVKRDTAVRNTGSTNGGINVNVVLVGDSNINASHTVKGQQNLNLLMSEVNSILIAGAKVGINSIHTYEWTNANGGDQYSSVSYDQLGVLFASGSMGVSSSDEGNYINVFLVSDIAFPGSSFTILGLSGGILGPPLNGLLTSGLAFATFDELGVFNASCSPTTPTDACARNSLQADFLEMGATIAHELGHYLGLNHPSERTDGTSAQRHDQLTDTPTCAPRVDSITGSFDLDQLSCYQDSTAQPSSSTSCSSACDAAIGGGNHYLNILSTVNSTPIYYCPAVNECEFNHLMWYTTKNRALLSGAWHEDGNLISPQASAVVQWGPFVR